MGWFAFAILSALVCGALASSKKRDVFVAVLVGLVLSVVGIIIYAFIPTATITCPKCGEPNATTRTNCKECKSALYHVNRESIYEKNRETPLPKKPGKLALLLFVVMVIVFIGLAFLVK